LPWFLHPTVTSSTLGPNMPHSILFLNPLNIIKIHVLIYNLASSSVYRYVKYKLRSTNIWPSIPVTAEVQYLTRLTSKPASQHDPEIVPIHITSSQPISFSGFQVHVLQNFFSREFAVYSHFLQAHRLQSARDWIQLRYTNRYDTFQNLLQNTVPHSEVPRTLCSV
jgi:hypothetical protein